MLKMFYVPSLSFGDQHVFDIWKISVFLDNDFIGLQLPHHADYNLIFIFHA